MKIIKESHPGNRLTKEQRDMGAGHGFVFHKSSQPFFRMEILIKDMTTVPKLYISHFRNYIYKIRWIIHFLKILEYANQNKTMIHGGALADNTGNAFIITGQSDVGKTTLVFLLAQRGYSILGDDKITINSQAEVFRFENSLGLYPHPNNLKQVELSAKQKILGRLKYLISKSNFLSNKFNPNLRVEYKKIGHVIDRAKFNKIFILENGLPSLSKLDNKSALNKILSTSIRLLMPEGFPKNLFHKYCFSNNISPTLVTDKAKEITAEAIKNTDIFLVKGKDYKDFYKLLIKHGL